MQTCARVYVVPQSQAPRFMLAGVRVAKVAHAHAVVDRWVGVWAECERVLYLPLLWRCWGPA